MTHPNEFLVECIADLVRDAVDDALYEHESSDVASMEEIANGFKRRLLKKLNGQVLVTVDAAVDDEEAA